jgi:hypothetical protein
LGKLSSCAWTCIQAEIRRALGRDDVQPGMIAAIQTFGELVHWHPHLHALVTCGAFTEGGEFLEVPEFDMERLETAWQVAVFALYLAEEKIEPEVVENMRTWPHSGFHVDQSVHLAADDRAGIERLMQYMTRCPFSLSRLVKVTETGEVVYKAEKDACRAFPDPQGDGLRSGAKRNFQVLSPLDFLAEFTQHIPPKGAHLVRYYGWYSNKARGMRRKAAEAPANANLPSPVGTMYPWSGRGAGGEGIAASEGLNDRSSGPSRASQTWAMLIKRVYEVDPLECAKCGGTMKVIAFLEPPQGDVIEKILRHCGLWRASAPRPPPAEERLVYVPEDDGGAEAAFCGGTGELNFVPDPDPPAACDVPWEVTRDAFGDLF